MSEQSMPSPEDQVTQTPDEAPEPQANSPETPEQPKRAPAQSDVADLTGEMEAEIATAMQSAMHAPEPTASGTGAPSREPARAAIRGPRVVEGGREHRHGAVVSVGPDDIFIEFGPKELGVAPRKQWGDEEVPKVGDNLEVVVDRFDPGQQLTICVRPGAVQKADWELLESGQVVEATVTGTNKGGLELEVANHRAFMPASQVELHRVSDLKPYVGEKIKCKITRVERAGKGNIVCSRRDILAVEREEQRKELQESIKQGQTVKGTVRKIMEFGAFVDIGGVDGLVHISDLSHQRVQKVDDVVKEGDEVTCKVLKVDWEKNRISLGMKQAAEDPFKVALKEIEPGEIVSGRVSRLVEFGAFVELAPNVEGLVHISELSWQRIPTPDAVVSADQVIKVKVLEVDKKKRRIALSLKQTTEQPAPTGRGRGRGEKDTRTEEEIRKETPAQRRLREQATKKEKKGGGGLGDHGSMGGMGFGDLDLSKFDG
jgi:small subunit ribosomal protein S1